MNPIQQLSDELRASARLRFGLYALVAMVWGYGLSEWWDHTQVTAAQVGHLRDETDRLAVYDNSKLWADRAENSAQLRSSLITGFYAGSRSQAQAQLRDALGAMVAQQRLKIIDLSVQSTDLSGTPSRAISTVGPAEAASANAGIGEPETLKARIVFEFAPSGTSALLLAISKFEKKLIVDRVTIRNRPATMAMAPQCEIELRAFLVPAGATP